MAIVKQLGFSSGEVSPRFHQRADIELYSTMLKECRNMYPVTSGAVTRRAGTQYFYNTNGVKFVDFVFNNQQVLLLEFGDEYMRVYNRDGIILSGMSPYELVTPYAGTDAEDIDTVQINDVVYIVHPNYKPRKLTRLADNNWTLTDVSFVDGAYEAINLTSTTLAVSGSSHPTHTVTASTSLFTANDVGRLLRFENPSTGIWIWGTITAYTSSTVVTWEVAPNQDTPSGTTTIWRLGAFYTGNYPSKVEYHQNRLWYASTPKLPSSGWGSVLNQLDRFSPSFKVGSADNIGTTNAIFFTLAGAVATSIEFMISDVGLVVGTESALFSSNIDTITPSSFSISLTSAIPLSGVPPIKVENQILAVSRLKNQVYGFIYSDETKGYVAQELSLYWDHIFNKGIKDMAYVSYPTPLVWFVLDDGTLASMTYNQEQKLVAVAQHTIAESAIDSVVVLPNSTSGFDELFLIGERNSSKFIAVMAREYDASFFGETKAISARYMDLYVKYSGTATDTFTGASHLADTACVYIADGIVGEVQVNSSGDFTLPFEASVVAVGLGYESSIKTIDIASIDEAYQGYKKQIHQFKVGFYESMYCFAQALFNRPDPQYVTDVITLNNQLEEGVAKTPITGVTPAKMIDNEDGEEAILRLWIEEPLPLTITSIYLDVAVTQI